MNSENMRILLGENIRALRVHYAISRKSLAKLVKVPVHRLRCVENGDLKAKLYDFHLRRLARILDVTVDALFEPYNPI